MDVPEIFRQALPFDTIAGASKVLFQGMTYAVGDIVLGGDRGFFEVEACIVGDGMPYLLGRKLEFIRSIEKTASLCKQGTASDIVALDISSKVAVLAKAWCTEEDGTLLVLHH